VPVEFVLLAYPILDAPPLPANSDDGDGTDDELDADPGG
jgi:hypothetical protein